MKTPADNEVQLWFTRVRERYDQALLDRFASLLNAEEKARWQRFVQPADRQRFLVARALVRTVLARLLGQAEPAALEFTATQWGKPELAGAAAGKLHFNLSHTDGLLVLAVSRAHEVGVDVEAVDRKVEPLALAQRFFATDEHAELLELEGQEQRERFFALWTLKEAWVKARGLGLRIPLDDFSFSFAGSTPVIHFGPQLEEHAGEWQFSVLRQRGPFRIALAVHCSAATPLRVQLHAWEPEEAPVT
jgi:4'-phosphopantetheinyl transferase